MECTNHAAKEAVTTCHLCGKNYCPECLVSLDDKAYCRHCLTEKMSGAGEPAKMKQVLAPGEKRSKFWAFVFSVVPGVGYFYLGMMNKGLQTMLLFFGSIFVAGFIGFEEIIALVVPVVVFYSIFDTQQLVKTINEGLAVEDRQFFDLKQLPYTHNWLGYALIVLGVLALLHNMPIYFPYWVKRLIPPFLIMGLGVVILYRNMRKDA